MAGDDEANEKYGYPADLDLLPISHETRELIKNLFHIWLSIAQGSKSKIEKEEFNKLNKEVFARLVSELKSIDRTYANAMETDGLRSSRRK